jgi:hypothetical protein
MKRNYTLKNAGVLNSAYYNVFVKLINFVFVLMLFMKNL